MVAPVKKVPADDRELRSDIPAPTPAEDNAAAIEQEKERRRLGDQLKIVDGWTEQLQDPELGAVGKAFRKATDGTLRFENVDFQMRPSAGYHSFIYPPHPDQESFSNYVLYGREALDNPERLMGARIHEFVHALQYQTSAVLHVDPFNDATNLMVSPYDYLLRKERLEQDAYVKGAWLCALAVDVAPDIVKAMKGSPLPIDTFQKIREKSASLQEAFEVAARDCRNLLGVWAKDAEKSVIADEWHARALEEYDLLLQYRHDSLREGETLTLVRLTGQDILEIGASFGPNTFGTNAANPALTGIENLSPANAKKLAEIEKKYGIAPRAELPTLDTALTAAGTPRAAFIQASRNHKGAAAEVKPTAEDTPAAANDAAPPAREQNTGPRPPTF